MAQLIIKNIGPIKDVKLDLNRINVFIGPQSSGKSTISKILCHCQWVEKSCYLDVEMLKSYEQGNKFYKSLVEYHRLDGYFNKTASIKYVGEYMTITYTHSSKNIILKETKKIVYNYPKICYIPSERNLVAAISNIDKYNESNDVILYFGYDWTNAKEAISQIDLTQILERNISYECKNGIDYIKDGKAEILLRFASSGILSLLPLHLTISYMCDIVYKRERVLSARKRKKRRNMSYSISENRNELGHNIDLNPEDFIYQTNALLESLPSSVFVDEIKKIRKMHKNIDFKLFKDTINQLSIKVEEIFNYRYTQLFIEEPELNLFPTAQMKFVNELFLLLNNADRKHNAVITTHSPYVLFAINNCIMRDIVKENITDDMKTELLDNKALIDPKDISIYQIENGTLANIQDEDGNLDENFINDAYKENSAEYFSLLNFYKDEE